MTIREAVQQALKKKIGSPIDRVKNTYLTRLWLEDDDEGFPRQGGV